MAAWEDVRELALSLPGTSESTVYGGMSWNVSKKFFCWERPLRKKDLEKLGESAPTGPILAVHVEDLGEKEFLLQLDHETYFTTPHFDGYAIVLIKLDMIGKSDLKNCITRAWLTRAPKRLVSEFLKSNPQWARS